MKMKRLLAIFALIAVLCTFCTVGVFANEAEEAVEEAPAADVETVELELDAAPSAKPGDEAPADEAPAAAAAETTAAETATAQDQNVADDTIYVEVADGTYKGETHKVEKTPYNQKPATCTTDGWIDYKCTEEKCAEQNFVHRIIVPATGHVWSSDTRPASYWGDATDDAPTCMTAGSAFAYCIKCNAKGEDRSVNAVNHRYDEELSVVVDVDNCYEYTYHFECVYGCGTKATYDKDVKAGDEYTIKTKDANGNDADFTVIVAKNAKKGDIVTVTEDPRPDENGEYKHVWGDWATEVAATCQREGRDARVCTVCSAKQTKTVKKLDHVWAVEDTHLDSCEKLTVTYYCTTCKGSNGSNPDCVLREDAHKKNVAHKQEVLTGDFHKWVEIPGTEDIYCDKDGATYRDVELECSYCGDTKTLEHVKISDYHMFGEWQVVNKVYKDGVEIGSLYVRRCTVCGLNEQKYFDKSIDPNKADPAPAPIDPTPVDPKEDVKLALSVAGLNVAADGVDGAANVVEVSGKRETDLYAVVYTTWENASGDTIMVGGSPIKIGADGSAPLLAIQPNSAYNKMTNAYVVILDDQGVAKTRVFGDSLILDRLIQVAE